MATAASWRQTAGAIERRRLLNGGAQVSAVAGRWARPLGQPYLVAEAIVFAMMAILVVASERWAGRLIHSFIEGEHAADRYAAAFRSSNPVRPNDDECGHRAY